MKLLIGLPVITNALGYRIDTEKIFFAAGAI